MQCFTKTAIDYSASLKLYRKGAVLDCDRDKTKRNTGSEALQHNGIA